MKKSGILGVIILALILVFSFNSNATAGIGSGVSETASVEGKALQREAVMKDLTILSGLQQSSVEVLNSNELGQFNRGRAGVVLGILFLAFAFCLLLAHKNGLLFLSQQKGPGKMWYDLKERSND